MKEFERLCNEYRENKRLIEELESMNDELKANIIALMGDNDTLTSGASKATYKPVTSTKFNSAAFKKEYPGLYDEYSNTTTYKRFTVA